MAIQKLGRNDPLCGYSIYASVAPGQRDALIKAGANDPKVSKAMGAMVGMALADAYGHMFEFLPAVDEPLAKEAKAGKDVPYFDAASHTFTGVSNAFHLQLGQWTDDTAMGLCIADSLICNKAFDGSDQRTRFWNWWNHGYNNAFSHDDSRSSSVGLGGNISKSLAACRSDRVPAPVYEAQTEDAGNGSLMRLAPISIMFAGSAALSEMARASSYTTHPGIIAAEACAFHAYVVSRALALEGPVDPKKFLDKVCEEYSGFLEGKSGWGWDQMHELVGSAPTKPTEACWNWRAPKLAITESLHARGRSYNGYPVSAGYFGAYSMDGLAMALHAVYNNSTFEDTVAHAMNLLGDADSTGSIAGQIAGALYGYKAVPEKWLQNLNKWDDGEIALRAVLLSHLNTASA
jgi:ADP-ribosyl-[dinitrogen reductase] hydrolase